MLENTCPACHERLVEDDTTGRVYCEQNADHTPPPDTPASEEDFALVTAIMREENESENPICYGPRATALSRVLAEARKALAGSND